MEGGVSRSWRTHDELIPDTSATLASCHIPIDESAYRKSKAPDTRIPFVTHFISTNTYLMHAGSELILALSQQILPPTYLYIDPAAYALEDTILLLPLESLPIPVSFINRTMASSPPFALAEKAKQYHIAVHPVDAILDPPDSYLFIQTTLILATAFLWMQAYLFYSIRTLRDHKSAMPLYCLYVHPPNPKE